MMVPKLSQVMENSQREDVLSLLKNEPPQGKEAKEYDVVKVQTKSHEKKLAGFRVAGTSRKGMLYLY